MKCGQAALITLVDSLAAVADDVVQLCNNKLVLVCLKRGAEMPLTKETYHVKLFVRCCKVNGSTRPVVLTPVVRVRVHDLRARCNWKKKKKSTKRASLSCSASPRRTHE